MKISRILMTLLVLSTQVHAETTKPDLSHLNLNGLPAIVTLDSIGLTPTYANLAFGQQSDSQKLDIYLPANPEQKSYPVVMFIHGGGFMFGDKSMSLPSIVKGLLDNGIAVVTTNYRLSKEATFPAAPQDIGRAIEFIKTHATDYHIDTSKLVMMGESSGANLAALSGTAFDSSVMRGALNNPQADIRPLGVVALYPPVDFLQLDRLMIKQGCTQGANHSEPDSFESQYLGGQIQKKKAEARAANPITYIDSNTPPFFVENGSNDCQVGTAQSQLLVNALKKKKIAVDYTLLEGAGHGGKAFEENQNVMKIVQWVKALYQN